METSHYQPSVQDDEYAAYAAQKNGSSESLEELGLSPSTRLTNDEQEALEKRMKLKRLEHAMTSQGEREQYFGFKSYLENDDERIAFLSVPTREGRDRLAMQKGIYFRNNKFSPRVKDAVNRSDIVLGMSKDAVMESWGEPESIEVAGNQLYGNERWQYIEYLSTAEGFKKEERVVIFEGGKVVGWQRF